MHEKRSGNYFVYLIQCRDGSLYCGIARDVKKRLAEHNSGRGSAYVKSRGGGLVVHTEKLRNFSAALRREAAVKKLSRTDKLKLINKKRLYPKVVKG